MTAARDIGVAHLRMLAAAADPRALFLLSCDKTLIDANDDAARLIDAHGASAPGLPAERVCETLGLAPATFETLLSAARGCDMPMPFLASVSTGNGARAPRKAAVQALRSGGRLEGYAIRLSAGVDPLEAFRVHRRNLERREAEAAALAAEEAHVLAERKRIIEAVSRTAAEIDDRMRRLLRTLAVLRSAPAGLVDQSTRHGALMAEEEARQIDAALVGLMDRLRSDA